MFGRILIDNHILTIFPIKINKEIYWVTTPHSCQLSSNKLYQVLFDNKKYQARLFKQAYYCDLAIFKIDNFNGNIKTIKIIKSKNNLLNKKLSFKEKTGFFIKNYFAPYLDINGSSRQMYYLCKFEEKVEPGDSGTPIYNENEELVGIISIARKEDTFLVPGFLIPNLINCKNNKMIPYLPIKLTMNIENKIQVIKSDILKSGDIITNIEDFKIKNDSIFSNELKDWIPIDTYILLFMIDKEFVNLKVNDDTTFRLRIENMNKYLKYPFNPNPKYKSSYQNLLKKKSLNYDLIRKNLIL